MWKIFIKITFQEYINLWLCNSYYEILVFKILYFQLRWQHWSLHNSFHFINHYVSSTYGSTLLLVQMRLNLLLGDNLTATLSCAAEASLRVFVACTVWAWYEEVINNGINYSALYKILQCSLTVVDLYVSTLKQAK